MPLTFPAHQAAVLPLKLWRPRWFDGTALVVGAGSPDLFNAFAFVDTFDSHHWDGVFIAVPFTILYALVLRSFAADGLFGSLPDFGPLKARSYRVLGCGSPRLLVTTWSALIGVLSHIIVDSFTHEYRIGSNLLGLERVLFEGPLGPVSAANLLQYIGHTFGSLLGMLLFVIVVSKRHLGEWYGTSAVADARRRPVRRNAGRRAAAILTLSTVAGSIWGVATETMPIFHIGLCGVIALLVVGIVNRAPTTARFEQCLDTSTLPGTTSSMSSAAPSQRT